MKIVIIIFVPTNVLHDSHNVCDTVYFTAHFRNCTFYLNNACDICK